MVESELVSGAGSAGGGGPAGSGGGDGGGGKFRVLTNYRMKVMTNSMRVMMAYIGCFEW